MDISLNIASVRAPLHHHGPLLLLIFPFVPSWCQPKHRSIASSPAVSQTATTWLVTVTSRSQRRLPSCRFASRRWPFSRRLFASAANASVRAFPVNWSHPFGSSRWAVTCIVTRRYLKDKYIEFELSQLRFCLSSQTQISSSSSHSIPC